MFFSLLYDFIHALIFLAYLPSIFYQMLTSKKYRKSFLRRWTVSFPRVEKKGPLIWIHAVSVGETLAVATLIKKLKKEMGNPTIVVSSVTETGFATQEKIEEADYHLFLPFDFPFLVRRAIRRCMPDMVILGETDFWYRFLLEARRNGAIIGTVNGKLSDRSWSRFKKASFFSKRLFSLIDTLCVQTEEMQRKFCDLGIPASKVFVTGNVKSDFDPLFLSEPEKQALKKRLQLESTDRVVVVGSTHEGEEEIILTAMRPLLEKDPSLKVVIVPRHPERFDRVADLLKKQEYSFYVFSEGKGFGEAPFQIILVDAMGVLRNCYQVADVAVVAGSFTPHVGGHNILEPAAYGVPTICGPYMYSQPFLVDQARQYNALHQVGHAALGGTISQLFSDVKAYATAKKNALAMVNASRGATERTVGILRQHAPEFFVVENSSAK